jgi:hypothetical protein
VQRKTNLKLGVDAGRRIDRWRQEEGTPVSAVEGCVWGKNHRRNVNLTFKKLNLRNGTKTTTNAGKTTANVNIAVRKPKHWSCKSKGDKSYKKMNKTSTNVRWTGETSNQITIKVGKDIKKRREKEKEEMWSFHVVLPFSLVRLKQEENQVKWRERREVFFYFCGCRPLVCNI